MHYCDVIMSPIAFQITSLTIVYSIVFSDADQRKHQSSASLAFVWGIHRGPVNSPHKWPVTRKMFPFDDVIMDRKCGGSRVLIITDFTDALSPPRCQAKAEIRNDSLSAATKVSVKLGHVCTLCLTLETTMGKKCLFWQAYLI